jgi:hypothetical protein
MKTAAEASAAVHELSPVSAPQDAEEQAVSNLKPRSVLVEVPEGITRIENVTRSWNRYALAGVYLTYV